jgi:hypothetical protein
MLRTTVMVVASASGPAVVKARMARMRAAGAAPTSRPCAMMAPAIAVPCASGGSRAPIASNTPAIAPEISGCSRSMPVSITPTSTPCPVLR